MNPHDRTPSRDLTVQWRIFGGIALFIAAIGTLYWFVSYEEAGTSMLALSSGLALLVGVFLWRHDQGAPATARASSQHEMEEHLPAASIWPFGIGVSAFLTFNGLILGLGYAVPGAILMAMSLAGFISQSRARS